MANEIIKLLIIALVIIGIIFIAYPIAISDLPFWFKFWLLK